MQRASGVLLGPLEAHTVTFSDCQAWPLWNIRLFLKKKRSHFILTPSQRFFGVVFSATRIPDTVCAHRTFWL